MAPSSVGADQFTYHRRHNPQRRYLPDIYAFLGSRRIRAWSLGRHGFMAV